MQKIRRGVFETNSSSTHSLTVDSTLSGDKKRLSRIEPDDGNCIGIYPGEFGWGPERHRNAATKASYAYTYAYRQNESEAPVLMARLRSVLEKETGCKVSFRKLGGYWPDGYIDHQSLDPGCLGEDIFKSDRALRDFIFNPSKVLVISNDNEPCD